MTVAHLLSLRAAVEQIGESKVTLATPAGVVTFDFADPQAITARHLPFESQPTRQELAAMLQSTTQPSTFNIQS